MKHPEHSFIRASLRTLQLVLWVLIMLPFVFVFWLLRLQGPRGIATQMFYAGAMVASGIRLNVIGEPSKLRPLMIVANHSSYLDVLVIGSQLPLSFTPKREVKSWPIIGFFCVLGDCVFVERRPAMMESAREEMKKRINAGRVLCLFPEGTTSDGKHIKRFKSGFLSLAEEHRLPVQPASVAYRKIGESVMSDEQRALVAWIGEATFFNHYWHVLALPSVEVTLRWHAPLSLNDFADRKALTKAAETIVVAGVMGDL